MVNQGAITECLPAAPLPVCDSGWNSRLWCQSRVWE